jgi:predicted kinase
VVAEAGHAVVADATFLEARHRAGIAAAAGGVPFLGVWLTAPLAVLERRVAGRVGDASDADVAVLRRAAAHDPGAGAWLSVDAADGDAALAAVRAALDSAV